MFHRDPIEFLRDLARALFLMEECLVSYAKLAEEGRIDSDMPGSVLSYYDPSLRRPEQLCSAERLEELRRNWLRAYETIEAIAPKYVSGSAVNFGMLKLCCHGTLFKRSIEEAQPSEVCEVLERSAVATLEEIAGGWLIDHRDYDEECFTSVYDELAQAVVDGCFLK